MEIQEFKNLVDGKTFESTAGQTYRFIGGTTLQLHGDIINSVHYEVFTDENDDILLDTKGLVPTKYNEHLKMEMNQQINTTDPISFVVHSKISNEFLGTWIEKLPVQ